MKYLKTFESYEDSVYREKDELDPYYEYEEEEIERMPGEEEAGDEEKFLDDEDYVEGSDDLDYQWRKLLEDPEFVKKLNTFNNESTCPSCNCKKCECGGMANEAKKSKSSSYKKSGLKNPEKADLNKDKKISGYEKTRGKAIQKSIEAEDTETPSKGKGKGKSEPNEKQKKGLPKELVDAMKKGLRD